MWVRLISRQHQVNFVELVLWERETWKRLMQVIWIRVKKGDHPGCGSEEQKRNLIFRGC